MTRRILINLAAFALLGVVMTVWALGNVLKFDVITRPYQISVEFASSPGLQPNFDVAYLGVKVGKIRTVRLGDHKVVAVLDLERGTEVPDNVTAAAGRKSAIGEPYVDLTLPAGTRGGPPLRAGAVIPLSRTSVAVTYRGLFAAANKAVQGLNPDDLHTVTHELAAGWNGRSESLVKILDSSEQITSTFAQNTDLLDRLIEQLTQISGTLARHRGELGSGLGDLASFTDVLANHTGQIAQLRDRAPDLVGRFNKILAATAPADRCILASLKSALPTMLSGPALDSYEYAIQTAPGLIKVLDEVSPKVNGKANLNIDFVITLQKPKPAPEYVSPLPLPTVGAIPATCPGIAVPAGQPGAGPAAGTTPKQGAGSAPAPAAQPTTDTVRNAAGKDAFEATDLLVWIPPLLALAILLRVVTRTIPLFRIRRRTSPDRKNRGA
ncbi:MAG: MCE family protein [Streptosporangiaceae bacterium]